MTWDTTAKKVAVKAIGTVESNMGWTAINYNDPITVGIAQWYGVRASGILFRMKQTPAWSGVAVSLDNDLNTIPSGDTYWNSRYLTQDEGNSIVPVLNSCQGIQTDQFFTDLDSYRQPAIAHSIDPDTDTDAFTMYCVGYHQGPAYANRAVSTLPANPTLAQVRDAFLNDPTLGAYPNRYNTAYNIIAAHDSTGVPDPSGTPGTPAPPVVGGGNPGASPTGTLKRIDSIGDMLRAYFTDGQSLDFFPNGRGHWMPSRPSSYAAPSVPGSGPVTPTPGNWVHPMPTGVITSPYGPRDPSIGGAAMHWGCDFSTPGYPGTIYAPADMVVTRVALSDGYGGSAGSDVKAHTTDGAYTFNFYHMEYGSQKVSEGQTVKAGTPIGIEGATGNVTGRHLHFELYEGNYANAWPPPDGPTPVDPVPVLRAHGVSV